MSEHALVLLGGMLVGDEPPGSLEPQDFAMPAQRAIFGAILRIRERGERPDLVMLATELRNEPTPWREQAHQAIASVGTRAALASHTAALKRERQVRELRATTATLYQRLRDNPDPEDAARVARDLERLAQPQGQREPTSIASALAELFLVGVSPAVPLGIVGLERLQVRSGHLCCVGARTGVGKSALLGTFALNAVAQGWQALYLSLEMPGREIRQRLLAGHSGVSLDDVIAANHPALGNAASEVAAMPIWIDADHERVTDRSVGAVAQVIERFAQRFADRPSVVLLDYLQLVRPTGRYTNRVEQVGEVVRELKATALRSKLPIIAAAQLSRALEQRGTKRSPNPKPQLSDLRESGEIEQAADQVLLVHRDGEQAWLRVAKNRHGETFTADATFRGPQCRFW